MKSSRLISSKEPAGPRLTEYLKSLPRKQQSIIDFIVALNQRLQGDIRYLVRMDPGVQPTEDTLRLRPAHAATRLGCWCRCCGISGSHRGSCPAI